MRNKKVNCKYSASEKCRNPMPVVSTAILIGSITNIPTTFKASVNRLKYITLYVNCYIARTEPVKIPGDITTELGRGKVRSTSIGFGIRGRWYLLLIIQ